MGLLDEAIREHLDLKLRNGADPQQIAMLEREALEPLGVDPAYEEAQHESPQDPAAAPLYDQPGEPQATVEFDMSAVIDPEQPHVEPNAAPEHEEPGGHEQLGFE